MDLLTHGLAGASIGVATCQLTGDGSVEPALVASTTIAALLPDLDFIFAIVKKPILAWRWHRVLLHNIAAVPLLATMVALAAKPFTDETSLTCLILLNTLALVSHLVLDLLTSFPTGVLFPFTEKRFAWGTHFLTDPLIGVLLAASLVQSLTFWMLGLLGVYLIAAVLLKQMAKQTAIQWQEQQGLTNKPVHLRPRALAPWQWLAIIEDETEYIFNYVTPMTSGSTQRTSRGIETRAARLYQNDELLQYFVKLADFPRFEDSQREDKPAIVVEDIQWWWKLPYRPMAISAVLDSKEVPCDARESYKFSTSPTG
ncbi:MAG: metal-dependent hydrolase [Planctomycetota bacterium]